MSRQETHSVTPSKKSSDHRLATVMFSDICGYTNIMDNDENAAMHLVRENLKVHQSSVAQYRGRIVKEMGDGLLVVFDSPTEAVACAKDIIKQSELIEDLDLHIGIHMGEVAFTQSDVFGAGVNIASRIESEAQAGQILVSEAVWDNIKNKKEFKATYAGSKNLKNVGHAIRLYHIHVGNESKVGKLKIQLNSQRRGLTLSFLFIVLISLVSLLYLNQVPWIDEVFGKQKIAILPFSNETNDASLAYLGETLAEDVIASLLTLKEYSVVSSKSSFDLSRQEISNEQIAERLKADLILSGEYELVNGELKLKIELVSSSNNEIIGLSTFKANLNKIHTLTRGVTSDLYKSLGVDAPSQEYSTNSSENLEASRYFALGRSMLRENHYQEVDSINTLFDKAIEIDPNFVEAYLGKVQAHLFDALRAESPYPELVPKIQPLLLEAQQISPDHPTLLGFEGILDVIYFNYSKGETKLLQAIEVTPNYDIFYQWLGIIQYIKGDFQASIDSFNQAIRLDPLNTFFLYFKGLSLIYMKRLDEADQLFSGIIDTEPENAEAKYFMGVLRLEQGRPLEAVDWLETRNIRGAAQNSNKNPLLGYAYGIVGRNEDAKSVLQYLLDKSNDDYVPPGQIAMVYAGLKDTEGVIMMAEKASLIGDPWLSNWGQHSCVFEDYLNNDRYQAAIRRVTYK